MHKLTRLNYATHCPLCHSQVSDIILNKISNPKLYKRLKTLIKWYLKLSENLTPKLFFCSRCQFGFFSPRPDLNFISRFYGGLEKSENHNEDSLKTLHSEALAKDANEIFNWITKHYPNFNNPELQCAEIGVGCGWLTKAAIMNKKKWTAIDSDKNNIQFIKEELKCKTIESFLYDIEESFDFFASVDTFEHLLNPIKELQVLFDKLNHGGALFLSVPNFHSYGFEISIDLHPYFAFPAHLNYFTTNSITHLLEKIGFKKVITQTTTFDREIPYILAPMIKNNKISYVNFSTVDEMRSQNKGERIFALAIK